MRRLHGRIRDYAWGSRQVIAQLQGRPTPSATPEAELWVGAHPDGPAWVEDGPPLDELIASAPREMLGADAVRDFGPRLPYLLKILAADSPLSIQAHPDARQASAGYAAEDAAGVARDAGERNYVDPYHKPELLVAITEFEVLCGFRPPTDSAKVIDALGIGELEHVLAALYGGRLREAVASLLTWPADGRADLVAKVATAAERLDDMSAGMVRSLRATYPADLGVVVALLLNHLTLLPGEAVWMPAGNLHAYLRGAGVEIMAASDNVLRGGLTGKHVDVAELLRVVSFEPMSRLRFGAVVTAPGVSTWPVPVPDFRLHRVCLDTQTPSAMLAVAGPRTVLCLAGRVIADDGTGAVELHGGESAFAAPGDPLVLSGAGEVYVASL